ncbi:MAG TPA: RIP metalloprotease RseP, partial [Proteobacteria bacterium]|nr:RIP metalloprotease RseP [Pseudomonadota bacterium]
MLQYLIAFIVLLGILIFVHELGHFLAARLFGIRVEIFSLGFGPRLLAWKRKHTEYRISAVPLGGYVKLFGEDPNADISPELARYSFAHQPPWKRAVVVAAGPLSNFILPLVLIAGIYMVGYPELAPVIGRVKPGYQAYKAGLLAGDRILEVDGQQVRTWEEMAKLIENKPNEPVELVVDREGWRFSVRVKTVEGEGTDIFGEPKRVGLIGIRPDPYTPLIGVSDIYGAGYVAGLRTGDEVIAINGKPIKYFFEIERAVWSSPDKQLVFRVKRGKEELDIAVKPRPR